MKRNQILFIAASLPVILGFLTWQAFRFNWLPDSILYLRVNLGFLLFLSALILSLLLGSGLYLYLRLERRAQNGSNAAQDHFSTEHRKFLQRLDHELKNPLTTLQVELANLMDDGLASPAQPQPDSDPSAGSPLERIRDQVTRLNDVVFQLRKLAELQTAPIEQTPVKLDELLDELVTEFSATKSNLTLLLPRMPWSLPEVRGDIDLLYLALRNVLGNAVKFTQPEDAIQVRAFEDTHHIVVEVADEGLGIPEAEIQHLMEELYRGKNARGLPGSGLGLALVKAIVERHGGQVTVRSREGQGTVVALRLPRM